MWQPFASDVADPPSPKQPKAPTISPRPHLGSHLDRGPSLETFRHSNPELFTRHLSPYRMGTLRYLYVMGQSYRTRVMEEWTTALHRMFEYVRNPYPQQSSNLDHERCFTHPCDLNPCRRQELDLHYGCDPKLRHDLNVYQQKDESNDCDWCPLGSRRQMMRGNFLNSNNNNNGIQIHPKSLPVSPWKDLNDEGTGDGGQNDFQGTFISHLKHPVNPESDRGKAVGYIDDSGNDCHNYNNDKDRTTTRATTEPAEFQNDEAGALHKEYSGSHGDIGSLLSSIAYECQQCGKEYSSQPAFSMHLRTHSRNSVCPFCGKRFSRPWLLQGHLRTHTGEKPYSCDMCSKSFADKSNLRAHQQTHSGLKPHVCRRCGKAFALKSYLYKHEESSCLRNAAVGCRRRHRPQAPKRSQLPQRQRQQFGCIKFPGFINFQDSSLQ